MESWKNVLSDYEICEWSEKDLPCLSDNRYVRQAYESGKWAFVSDVFRLFALYTRGGIYLDTDVEVRKSFTPLLDNDFFIGSEKNGNFESIGTGTIGAVAQNPIIKNMLSVYDNIDFIPKNRIPDLTPNTVRLVPVLQKYGISNVYSHDKIIEINDKSRIYPDWYFCVDTPDSFCVHHFLASWIDFECKLNLHIPLGRNNWLGIYRYKRNKIKPSAKLSYPAEMKKKILEWDYAERKKILLTYEEKINES